MFKRIIASLVVLVLVISIYKVIFQTRTVTYIGEDENWFIEINSKLVGLNGSYRIEIQYKGNEVIRNVDFNIHPHYEGVLPSLNKDGYYYWECRDDCGYYDKKDKLLFFVVWKEANHSGEKMRFIDLRKISN
jgi:hypothetical protein